MRLAALLLSACATAKPLPATLSVRVVEMPTREVQCWMPEIPRAPELRELDFEDDDILSRTMIHRLDYAQMVQFAMEMQSWAEETQKCVNELRGVEP